MSQSKKWVIFDLDNCVCDDEHRVHLIQTPPPMTGDRWAAYHAACWGDTVNLAAQELLVTHCVEDGLGMIVFTGRTCDHRGETVRWMEKHFRKPDIIMMRNVGDHIGAVAMKQRMLDYLVSYEGIQLKNVLHAYDDRQDIVDMYKSHGIPATRLFVHDRAAGHPTQPDMIMHARFDDGTRTIVEKKPLKLDQAISAIERYNASGISGVSPQWMETASGGVLHDAAGRVLGGYNSALGGISSPWLEGKDVRIGRYISPAHAKAAVEEALKNVR